MTFGKKIGDLVRHVAYKEGLALGDDLIGLVMNVFDDGDIYVLFEDGEYQVDGGNYEVVLS